MRAFIFHACLLSVGLTACAPRAHHHVPRGVRAHAEAPGVRPAPSAATPTPTPPAGSAETAVPEQHPAPGVLLRVVEDSFRTLATDYGITISAGAWISYPLFVSYRRYTDDQVIEIRTLLERLRIAESTRLTLDRDGLQPEAPAVIEQIKLDLRHVDRLIYWMDDYERIRAQDTKPT